MARCRSCGAEIMWAKLPSGALNPINGAMVPKVDARAGLVAFRASDGQGIVLKAEHVGEKWVARREVTLHESHYATCPKGDEHRGRGRQQLALDSFPAGVRR